ncbi:hypothetical protein Tco_0680114 [Tanacetum coccineum]|uniref:Uncharacterized protein n=1 Tax=Tanacetum coccineum TaxID=301880 RepID=A0ABQ4XJP8_9ASTR
MGDTTTRTRFESVSKLSNDPLLARESSGDEESLGEDASKQGRRITDIDDDEDITLVNNQIDAHAEMFDVDTLTALKSAKVQEKGDVIKEPSVPVSTVTASTKDIAATTTTATIPTPGKGFVFQEPGTTTTTTISSQQPSQENVQDKGKGKMAKIEADHELAHRLRKHFATKRVGEKRNKPPTQAQQRKIMCTYLKNMEGKNPKDLKNKSFDSIHKMFDRAFKRVNTIFDFRTYLGEGSSKRAGEELEQESSKKQKVDDDKETTELKSLIEVIPDEEEVALDVGI